MFVFDKLARSWWSSALLFFGLGCSSEPLDDDALTKLRERMIGMQLQHRDITDPRVLEAFRLVPRHRFVPPALREHAYEDRALPIGHDQTISQPYVVAKMTQLAKLKPDARVLEIGAGSGYQAAILAQLVDKVYSIEIVAPLAEQARRLLAELHYDNVEVREGDGYRGWPEQAPFDAILVTAAPDHVPQPLIDQLKPGGRLILPVGDKPGRQELLVVHKKEDGTIERREISAVAFVPMTGEARRR